MSNALPGNVPCPIEYAESLQLFRRMVKTVYDHVDEFMKVPEDEVDKDLLGEYMSHRIRHRQFDPWYSNSSVATYILDIHSLL